MFLQTLAQNMGPEVMLQYIVPEEVVKRFAASVGIDVLNLVKTPQMVQQAQQQKFEQAQQMEMTKQTAAMMSTPQFDPSKNPNAPKIDGENFAQQAQAGGPQAPPGAGQPPAAQ